jgi:aminopeptidase N
LPRERDEQILPRVLGRARRALAAYLGDTERERLQPEVERFLWAGANDVTAPFGIRKPYLDAFVGAAATPEGTAKIASLAASDSAAGAPTGNPTRWDAVTRLLVVAAPDAERLLALEAAKDSSPDGRRRAFIAGAARGDSATKRTYFERYFADQSLNEDWASGSLGAFNALEHQALTLPYLKPALDSLRYIQANRRIFFLGAWLGAFLSGQTSEVALGTVRRFLAARFLAPDLRRKVQESADELERTVEIRRRFAPARRTP